VEQPEANSVDDQYQNNEKTESKANRRSAAAGVAARIDPEPGPRQRHQQKCGTVNLSSEEVDVRTERRRQLFARVRPFTQHILL